MNDQLDRLEVKLDNIQLKLNAIEITQAVQAEQLKEHIRHNQIMGDRLHQIEANVEPIEEHVQQVEGAIKFLGITSVIIGVITGIAAIVGFL